MDIQTFIQNFKEAFGENAELPLVFWYSDEQKGETEKINGCFFKGMKTVRDGGIISLNAENIGCGGGKFYTGFTEMPEHVPTFVSLKEKYKQTPEQVIDYIEQMGVSRTENKYLHFARIDKVESLEEIEGVVFLANPDMLSGLTTWAFYDNNAAGVSRGHYNMMLLAGIMEILSATIKEMRVGPSQSVYRNRLQTITSCVLSNQKVVNVVCNKSEDMVRYV
ncbi:DUF169 domain-containing protein [Bacteroides ovatus]|uniref:Uncharacterized ArCR, COG2043 n=1 Tax=Bacteroides ovatus TaxID=28116 RepID=A0A1G8KQU8_BACOV|nr:DUF169 domain-containing protein [Bacteroides ovatus]SDI45746.1 Uncharacterised ArCR, COG2043 [Bacteroides ovatus]